jgi:hypothetical protein
MKNTILLLILIIFTSSVIAQSKKEIIEILSTRIDSLNTEMKKRDFKYEQEVISNIKNNQILLSQIEKHEDDLKSAKMDFDSLQRINNQLNENNLKLLKELGILNDSIAKLNREILSSSGNDTINNLLSKIKSEYFFMNDFPEQNKLVRDSLFEKCDDDRCAYILLTNGFLVASYVMNFGNDFGTMIIDLKSKKDLMSDEKNQFSVDGFDKNKNTLIIGTSGYDNNGRYWRVGTWSFNEKIVKLGKKEY